MENTHDSIYMAFSQADPNSPETMVLDSLPKAIGKVDFMQTYIKNNKNNVLFKKLVVFNFDTNEGGGYDIDSIQNKKDNIVFAHIGDTLINRVNSQNTQPFLDISSLKNEDNVDNNQADEQMLSQLTRNKIKNLASSHFDKWAQSN